METIKIREEYIKLDSFLKLAGVYSTGGQAKLEIQGGYVKLNGETCTQRGKKIRPGDKVEIGGKIYVCDKAGL